MSSQTHSEILFGKIARQMGLVSEGQIQECLQAQKTLPSADGLGSMLVSKGYLDVDALEEVLLRQQRVLSATDPHWNQKLEDRLFGRIAVKQGLCVKADLHRAVRSQAEAHERGERRRIGDVLVSLEVLTPAQRDEVLELQAMQLVDCPGCDRKYPRKLLSKPEGVVCLGCGNELKLVEGKVQVRAMAQRSDDDGSKYDAVDEPLRHLPEGARDLAAQGDTDEFVIPDEGLPDRGILTPELEAESGTGSDTATLAESGRAQRQEAPVGAPQRIGSYEIRGLLGRGAMGVVYEARDTTLDRHVALKVLPADLATDPKMRARFKREGIAASKLDHPNLVRLYGAGEADGVHYLAMEFVDGKTVKALIAHKRLSPREAAEISAQCARALDYAHREGVVHRDIKPENIIVRARDRRPMVMDFGLAREGGSRSLTQSGQIVGTPSYMAPEMIEGDHKKVDGRSDLYSLGATLYEMVTGRRVVDGPDLRTILSRVLFEEPTPPRVIREAIPIDLETILLKTLEKDPARRYETGNRLAEDLEAFIEGDPISARPPTFRERAQKFVKRRKPLVIGVGVAAAALLFGLVALVNWAIASSKSEETTRDLAQERLQRAQEAEKHQREQQALIQAEKERLAKRARAEAELRPYRAVVYTTRYPRHIEICLERFKEAIRIDPSYAEAYMLRGRACERLGRYQEALSDYDRTLKLEPGNDSVTYLAVRLSFIMFERNEARGKIQAILDRMGKSPSESVYTVLSQTYLALIDEQFERIEPLCERARKQNPTFADIYYVRASLQSYFLFGEEGMAVLRPPREYGDTIGALEDLDTCLDLDPTHMEAYLLRGILREQQHQSSGALRDFNAAVSLNPESARARFWRARQFDTMGQHAEAARGYDEAIELSHHHRTAYAARGIHRFAVREFTDAEADFTRVIDTREFMTTYMYFCRAITRACLGKLDDAEEDWKTWLSHHAEIRTGLVAMRAAEEDPLLRGRMPDVMLDQDRMFVLPPERRELMRRFESQSAESPLLRATLDGFGRFGEITFQHLEFMKHVHEVSQSQTEEAARIQELLSRQNVEGGQAMLELSGVIYEYLTRQDFEMSLLKRQELREADQYYQRATTRFRRSEFAQAIADLREAVGRDPYNAEYQYAYAVALAWDGWIEEALPHLELAKRYGWERWDYTKRDPAFTHMRENPRFQALVEGQ